MDVAAGWAAGTGMLCCLELCVLEQPRQGLQALLWGDVLGCVSPCSGAEYGAQSGLAETLGAAVCKASMKGSLFTWRFPDPDAFHV